MRYISTATWRDITDGHLYREGEPFPFDGREIPPERTEALETGRNRAGLRLIRAVATGAEHAEEPKQNAAEETAEAPETAAEAEPAKPKKTRRKTK